jgi:hypothetical protein
VSTHVHTDIMKTTTIKLVPPVTHLVVIVPEDNLTTVPNVVELPLFS